MLAITGRTFVRKPMGIGYPIGNIKFIFKSYGQRRKSNGQRRCHVK